MSKMLHDGEYIRLRLGAGLSKNSEWEFYHLAKYFGQRNCNRVDGLEEELMGSAGKRNGLVKLVHVLGDYSSSLFLGSADRANSLGKSKLQE